MGQTDATTDEATHVWVVRHGETEWSRTGRHTGSTDVPLTAAGEQAAVALRPVLDGRDFAAVWVSPRLRARRTAELAGLTDVTIVDELHEWDYGDYEGLTRAQIYADHADWDLWNDGCPGGETPGQVARRVDGVIARCREVDGTVLVVAHGHVLRSFAARWVAQPIQLGAHLELLTARVSVLGEDRGTPTLELWNAESIS
jgi:broad specificity phosphatase PhoE